MQRIEWEGGSGAGDYGQTMKASALEESDPLYAIAASLRARIVETLSEGSDELLEIYLEGRVVPAETLLRAIRAQTLAQRVFPVVMGSAAKYRGVQPLLDAVVDFLPSPTDKKEFKVVQLRGNRPTTVKCDTSAPLCALIFKVHVDKQRGPLAFVRVYSGVLKERTQVQLAFASSVDSEAEESVSVQKERVLNLYEIHANAFFDVKSMFPGNIGAVSGFKNPKTGMTISDVGGSALLLPGLVVPPPVFVRSVEADSPSDEKILLETLKILCVEDPSLHLSTDTHTGQIVIAGMGQLHLEIIGERLIQDYNVKCRLGKIRISFSETVVTSSQDTYNYEALFAGKKTYGWIDYETESNRTFYFLGKFAEFQEKKTTATDRKKEKKKTNIHKTTAHTHKTTHTHKTKQQQFSKILSHR
eukprot:TRINITY_DN1332_c0_g1_i4.p1 TRINITY_DN1332_c0_g1~~TRINITY_DN1332_c0_g1_i4.p1  ORF type:complete len:415 (+),score=114.94 TRINITY_DN1332_c0_g1_i4:732-1976(+)